MPSRTRTKASREMKENVEAVKKSKLKSDGKVKKPSRKALADKTNSLSDDNASIDVPIKTTQNILKSKTTNTVSKEEVRPRRDRRLPSRFIENQVLTNLSNSKDASESNHSSVKFKQSQTSRQIKHENVQQLMQNAKARLQPKVEVLASSRPKRNCRLQSVKEVLAPKKQETPDKQGECTSSFKTSSESFNSSLIADRPKRTSRLPPRLEDHSISPNKFIPVQPCFASTPIIQKSKARTEINQDKSSETKLNKVQAREKKNNEINENLNIKRKVLTRKGKRNMKNVIEQYYSRLSPTNMKMKNLESPAKIRRINYAKNSSNSLDKTSPDSNNNPKRTLPKRVVSKRSPTQKSLKTKNKTGFAKRMLEKSLSFRVFEDRKEDDKNQDIYEFTYDPKEEPQKKKRKKPAKKRPPKPKTVVFKNNYDANVAKALESLRSKVSKPELPENVPTQPLNASAQPQNAPTEPKSVPTVNKDATKKIQVLEDIIIKPASEIPFNITPVQPVNESGKNSVHISNYASINVDDIAADFESIGNDINYSPVHSPLNSTRPKTPEIKESAINHKDPLNLQGDMSFFNTQPVASSSINVSIRDPIASPWRVEFGNLPIRWQANTYLKPNMTPAVDNSFINSEETSKKHVYTNMVCGDPLPEPPALKQPTIMSFMRECAEKSMKKKRSRSISPKKTNSSLENSSEFGYQTPKKARKALNNSKDKSCDKENSNSNQEVSIQENNENSKDNSNTSEKSKNKNGTFFGFDDTGSIDQENVSPKNMRRTRARGLRQKSRTVLQELNALTGPTRAVIPKTKLPMPSSDLVSQLYNQIKSAEEVEIPKKDTGSDKAVTSTENLDDSDDSVHLFEDIEVVHHLKLQRKSYGKAKKVTFRQRSNSDSSTSLGQETMSSFGDMTFEMPNIRQKKVTKKKPKKKVSKKEKQEVDAWAAGFNSMCKDISDFPLVVE